MTTTVTLSPEVAGQVNELVETGRYASTDEAVEHLLANVLGSSVPSYSAQELTELREAAAEADRGEFSSPEEIKAFFEDWRQSG